MLGKCKAPNTCICNYDCCCIECPENDICNMQCSDVDKYEYCVECPEYEEKE